MKGDPTRPIAIILLLLLSIAMVGRYQSGAVAWGINHLAYLPSAFYVAWVVVAAVSVSAPVQKHLGYLIDGRAPAWLFDSRFGLPTLAVASGVVFYLLRSRTFFLGDGLLIGELVARGESFRAFDNMDFLLHARLYRALAEPAGWTPWQVYQTVAVIAGVLTMAGLVKLVARLGWEPWRRLTLVALVLLTAPATLFMGYVESYTLLYACLLFFVLTGWLALEGRAPLWPASLCFGLGLFFHMLAIVSAPALIYLAFGARQVPLGRRLLSIVLPPIGLLGLAFGAYLLAGVEAGELAAGVLGSSGLTALLIPASGTWGFFSFYNLTSHLNLLLLTAPACVAVVVWRAGSIRRHLADARIRFLLVQVTGALVFSLLIDRKLGAARDWDLLAAQWPGLIVLAVVLIAPALLAADRDRGAARPAREAALVITVSALLLTPWLAVSSSESASVARFQDLAEGFPPYARGYAYEDLGQYYKDHGDLERATLLYEKAVAARPGNPRFHGLLGWAYAEQAKQVDLPPGEQKAHYSKTEACYRRALELDPGQTLIRGNLARLLLSQHRYEEAHRELSIVTTRAPGQAWSWEALGFTHLKLGDPVGAVPCFERSLSLEESTGVRQWLRQARQEVEAQRRTR